MITNHHMVAVGGDTDVEIYVREACRDGAAPEDHGQAVLFIHGATYPGVVFDLPIPGYSWLERMVSDGFAAYAMDVRGYGRSTRPAAMDHPPVDNPPFATAAQVIGDIDKVIDFIMARTGVAKVHMIGHSWGTVTGGMYASRFGARLQKLVLFAPVFCDRHPDWLASICDPEDPGRIKADLGSYRITTEEMMTERWMAQLRGGGITDQLEGDVLRCFLNEVMTSDPTSQTKSPPGIRSPNGVLVDIFSIFSETSIYPPEAISVPCLVVRGSEDTDSTRRDALGLFDRLGSADKHYVEIAQASHFVMMERGAGRLHRSVAAFFEV